MWSGGSCQTQVSPWSSACRGLLTVAICAALIDWQRETLIYWTRYEKWQSRESRGWFSSSSPGQIPGALLPLGPALRIGSGVVACVPIESLRDALGVRHTFLGLSEGKRSMEHTSLPLAAWERWVQLKWPLMAKADKWWWNSQREEQ